MHPLLARIHAGEAASGNLNITIAREPGQHRPPRRRRYRRRRECSVSDRASCLGLSGYLWLRTIYRRPTHEPRFRRLAFRTFFKSRQHLSRLLRFVEREISVAIDVQFEEPPLGACLEL